MSCGSPDRLFDILPEKRIGCTRTQLFSGAPQPGHQLHDDSRWPRHSPLGSELLLRLTTDGDLPFFQIEAPRRGGSEAVTGIRPRWGKLVILSLWWYHQQSRHRYALPSGIWQHLYPWTSGKVALGSRPWRVAQTKPLLIQSSTWSQLRSPEEFNFSRHVTFWVRNWLHSHRFGGRTRGERFKSIAISCN